MKHIVMLFALLFLACSAQPDASLYGTKYVAVIGCPEPHATWARNAVPLTDRMGGSVWRLADAIDAHDVEVRCTESLASGVGGEYHLGDSFVRINELVLTSENDVTAAVEHELTHWRIYVGPHPERATMHVCRQVTFPHDPPECYPDWHGTAVMNPNSTLSEGCSGGGVCVGDFLASTPQMGDVEFTRWALSP